MRRPLLHTVLYLVGLLLDDSVDQKQQQHYLQNNTPIGKVNIGCDDIGRDILKKNLLTQMFTLIICNHICIQVLSRDRLLDYLVFSPTMMIVIHEFTAFCQNRMKTIRSGTNSSQFERDHVYHIGSIVVIRESTNLECPRFTVFNAILKYTTKIRCPNSFIFHCLLFVCF